MNTKPTITDGECTERPNNSYRVVASAVNHPDPIEPYRAVFNERSLAALSETTAELDTVVPTPFAPPVGPYSEYRNVPDIEERSVYNVHHPRFLYALPKRFLYHVSGNSFAKRVPQYVDQQFETPDVIHACHIYLDGYGMLPYCRKHDLPLFVVAHGALLNEFDELTPPVRSRVSETLEASERVLCVSEALATKARQLVDESKVTVHPLGADPELFPVERQETLRQERDIDQNVPVLLFCGAFIERKGIPELVEAIENIERDDVPVICIGHGGPLESYVRQRLRSVENPTRTLTGVSTEELRAWFALADTLVLPSRAEGRPTVIYEAMASQTAVVASNVGGIPEQVADGETGVLVPDSDVSVLRDTLDRCLDDPAYLRQMGFRGRERLVRKGWTWEQHGERLASIHRSAIK